MRRDRHEHKPRERKAWVMPNDEEILKDGGYFDDGGMWVSTPAKIARRASAARTNAALTPEMRRASAANMAEANAAITPEMRRANIAKVNAALTTEIRQRATRRKCTVDTPHGVRCRKGRHSASIVVNRRKLHIGYFDTKEEAIAARQAAELKYWNKDNGRTSPEITGSSVGRARGKGH